MRKSIIYLLILLGIVFRIYRENISNFNLKLQENALFIVYFVAICFIYLFFVRNK